MIALFVVVSFELDVSIRCLSHSIQNVFFSIIVFGLVVMDFLPFFDLGDKFFQSNDKWNCQLVMGLRQDLQVII